ncbi:hypothetical protein ACS3SW_05995 [Roseobacteraceae bacterium S113]
MRTVLDGSDAAHQLHVLAPSDAVCLARLRARNAAGTHPFEVSEAQYYAVTKHFVAPSEDEGFTIVHHA